MRGVSGCDEVDRFGWVLSSAVQEAGCLTLVRDSRTSRVVRAFGGVLEESRLWDFEEFCEEAFAREGKQSMIGVRRLDDWTLVAEYNWFEGTRPEVLERVSADTEAVSAFWNVDSLTRFTHAVGGRVRTSFEALFPERRGGSNPDALETLRQDLPWGGRANPIVSMLALAARVTGRALTPDCFRGDFLTCPVVPWPAENRGESYAG